MPYLLDTNICIHLINGDYNLSAKLKQVKVENCFLSELTFGGAAFWRRKQRPDPARN